MTLLPEFTCELHARLLKTDISDEWAVRAAKVSVVGDGAEYSPDRAPGMIRMLVESGHGSPFEHVSATFALRVPIFVAREVMRHRIASYNEKSSRYSQISANPVFYLPPPHRPLRETGKAGALRMLPSTPEHHAVTTQAYSAAAYAAVRALNAMKDVEVAREVSSRVLGVNVMTSFYMTLNLRSLTNFLSLRIFAEDADRPSFPQWEIEQVALQMEAHFREAAPITYAAWVANGRRPL